MPQRTWDAVDRHFASTLALDDAVLAAASIQTVGLEGYDGFALALVTGP